MRMLRIALLCAATRAATSRKALADGCARVYVDYGSNAGIQVRKLYEPKLFEIFPGGNPIEPVFREVFGENRDDVCSFGFEANPRHTSRLSMLELAYRRTGRSVTFFTNTAVTTENKNVTFYVGRTDNIDMTATMHEGMAYPGSLKVVARGVDLAEWMIENVMNRLPPVGAPTAVLMKSDIEGEDMAVLDKLMSSGVLCNVHTVYGEHMEPAWWEALNKELKVKGCATKVLMLDDEAGDGGEVFLRRDSKYFLPLPRGHIKHGPDWIDPGEKRDEA